MFGLALAVAFVLLLVAVYIFFNGQSHTVTTPDTSGVHSQINSTFGHYFTLQNLGTVVAFLLVGWLLWAIWTKLPKGAVVFLVVLVLLSVGVVTLKLGST